MRKLVLILVAMMGCSCALTNQPSSKIYSCHYNVSLTDVLLPSNAKDQYSKPVIKTINDSTKVQKYSYSDENITIEWNIRDRQLGFILTNETMHTAHIIWNEAVFVDIDGASQKITHAGIKYVDKDQPMANSSIAAKTLISDCVIPVKNIYYKEYVGWTESHLLPKFSNDKEGVIAMANKVVGGFLRVVLPIRIQGVTNEYTFIFKVNGYVPLWDTREDAQK